MSTHIKEAMERAGGVAAVASHFGISPVSVYEWIKRGMVPAEKCPEIEKLSGGAALCEDMNDRVDWGYVRSRSLEADAKGCDSTSSAGRGVAKSPSS